ncbi:helix-turn-helix transcriptional regulator [Bacillus alkalicellulosilyticus]|uniref:helix-turn-helix transcriptional regulator n=1 Tax=Alkalihalobacterium alkalicellulosilyticum TaxID=1912214 RepID=UPI00099786DC|nr:helix-turn-helix domain-containing protein [Bacillus alkalicellulosilyticus]
MDKEAITKIVTEKIRLVRTEKEYTQDKMAEVLGISKKTLVQIEKGRTEANWTTVIAVCALFRDSDTLRNSFGGNPLEVVELSSHESVDKPKEKTMGGKVWWHNVAEDGKFKLQQNVISQHYRIIDDQDHRWFSSFSKEDTMEKFNRLTEMIK